MRVLILFCCLTVSCSAQPSSPLSLVESEDQIQIYWKGNSVMTYQITTAFPPEGKPAYYQRSGFLHPVCTPSGQIITDDFPEDHEHQHGWFYAIRQASFRDSLIDFWNQHYQLGTVALRSLDSVRKQENQVDLFATLDHISTAFGAILEEKWHLQVIPGDSLHQFIWETTLTNITEDTLFAEPYSYGGLGMRGPARWNEADSVHFRSRAQALTSLRDTIPDANHTRPFWTAMFGELEQGIGGWAAFDHPENFRYPQPVRVHPEMPYFCLAPMVDYRYALAPGEPMQLRYTIVTFDGEPNADVLDRMKPELQR